MKFSNFSLRGFCFPNINQKTNIFSQSTIIPNDLIFPNQRFKIKASNASNKTETKGLLHIQKQNLNITNGDKEWRKSVVILRNGFIEICDIENDTT